MICVYKITNPNNGVYVGQTVDFRRRMKSYEKHQCKQQLKLFNSIKKYGWKSHVVEIIEQCDVSFLNEMERYWQEYYDVMNLGLNLKLTETDDKVGVCSEYTKQKMKNNHANMCGENNPFYGKSHSNEAKQAISAAHAGKIISNEMKKRLSEILSGRVVSDNTKEKMKRAQVGHVVSAETAQKISESNKRWLTKNKHSMLGKIQSVETRIKISDSRRDARIYTLRDGISGTTVCGGRRDLLNLCKLTNNGFSRLVTGKAKTYKGWSLDEYRH